MEQLRQELDRLIALRPDAQAFRERLETLLSVYPFNEYEFIIANLLGAGTLGLEDYLSLRESYFGRNLFLYIFEISAPRGFGEAWAQGHLKGLAPELVKPSRQTYPGYSGEFDFLLDGTIRIEVKASRAVNLDSDEPLYVKALSSHSSQRFDMNFQQVKPACGDVFVWVAVWRDVIRYWVLASHELATSRYFSPGQHRGNTGEGQLHLRHDNIQSFDRFETASNALVPAIRAAFQREKGQPQAE